MGHEIRSVGSSDVSRYIEVPTSPSGVVPIDRAQRADEHFTRRTFDARCGYCARVTHLLHSGEACPNCGARDWSAAVVTRAAIPIEQSRVVR